MKEVSQKIVMLFKLKLRQKPLLVMEKTIINVNYMGLEYSIECEKRISNIKEICKKVHGNFNLLWHNCHFENVKDKELYKQIIL